MLWTKNNDSDLSIRLKEYELSRHLDNRVHLCHAPFNNMYFNIHGQAAPCWLTLTDADNIKDKTIAEIWQGERFNSIRQAIQQKNLNYACTTCQKNIASGNYVSALAKLYDLPYALTKYPAEMEFELSNICNLECVMCKGDLSSAIRKNREHLPPIESPYNDSFVEQLKEFLPHLKEAKFLGGEPFLIPVYYKIWDAIIALNPKIKITVTTNGTVWNARVKQILESLHCNIILSIDAFTKETYEKIRLGSNFEKVIENFGHFRKYTKERETYMGISVNPLRKNYKELAGYVHFCNKNNVSLWFNTVIYPYREAIWTLSASELKSIYHHLYAAQIASRPAECSPQVYENNIRNFKNLVEVQIRTWWQQAMAREADKNENLLNLAAAELAKKLQDTLLNYVSSDAYLPQNQKQAKVELIQDRIKSTGFSEDSVRRLFTLHEEECIDYFEKLIIRNAPDII